MEESVKEEQAPPGCFALKKYLRWKDKGLSYGQKGYSVDKRNVPTEWNILTKLFNRIRIILLKEGAYDEER